jgi:hypothetical protein
MKKWFTFAIALSALVTVTPFATAQGQGQGQGQDEGNPFVDHSDKGEVLHVLPTPASIRSPQDPEHLFAPPSGEYHLYSPSYGRGNLINHGGPQINNAGFMAIYWNGSVANSTAVSGSYGDIKTQIDTFIGTFPSVAPFSASVQDDYSIIQQYGTATTPISYALTNYAYFIDTKPTQSSISDSAIRSYLAGLFSSGVVAADNIIYGVYFPAGMTVTSGTGSSCSTFCGYHGYFSYGGRSIKYAVFPYLSCSACKLSNLTVGDMLTIVASHEIREAVTDPLLNSWFDRRGYEADDKCAWHNLYQTWAGFWVQPEYSNGGTIGGISYPGAGCFVAK